VAQQLWQKTTATRAGKITPVVAGSITVVTAPLGDLISPTATVDEDFESRRLEFEKEIAEYQRIIDEINEILAPMLEKFHIDPDDPC
jgi:hypothetical protein